MGAGYLVYLTDSLYLIGHYKEGLFVWNEKTDTKLFTINSDDSVYKIHRVLSTKTFIMKSPKDGIKVLKIEDLNS